MHPLSNQLSRFLHELTTPKNITGKDGCLLTQSIRRAWALAVSTSRERFVVKPVKNVEKPKHNPTISVFLQNHIFCQTIRFVLRNMKKRNEDDPDNLGGLGGMLPAEVLKMLNELLEQQHRTGHPNNGSKIEIVYVASGAQHVENQINIGKTLPSPPCVGKENGTGELPDELATDKAMALWRKAQQAGYVDEHYQPLISRTQAALLADAMAERLGIKEKWKVFEALWHRKYMRSDYNLALTRKGSLDFQDELKQLFG